MSPWQTPNLAPSTAEVEGLQDFDAQIARWHSMVGPHLPSTNEALPYLFPSIIPHTHNTHSTTLQTHSFKRKKKLHE